MNYKSCADYLKSKDNFLILTHRNPDGDTLGSAGALCSALRRLGKNACLYRNNQITAKFLPYVENLLDKGDFSPECVISVDVAAEKLFPNGFDSPVQLCIDHHPSNSRYAENLLLYGENAACGEIVLELIRVVCGSISKEEATLLYIAIATDTGCFQYANTNAATFQAAAKLLACGVDNGRINTEFFRKKSAARLRLEGMIYSNMKLYRDGKISVVCIDRAMIQKAGAEEDDLDDISALAGQVKSCLVGVTIREQNDGSSRVSLRTGEEVNSSEICSVFGGGGHAMAAGCTISCAPDKAAKMILEVINEVWK